MSERSPHGRRRELQARCQRALWGTAIILLALLALRALLPVAAELGLERGVSSAVRGALALDDVDLDLLRRTVVLEGVRFGEPEQVESDPTLRIARLRARLGWRDLFERRVRVEDLAIHGPHLVVRRRGSGRLALQDLLAPAGAPSGAAESGTPSDRWTFALDRGSVEGGRIRLVDLSLEEPGRWEGKLSEVEVARAAFEPGAYEEPTRVSAEGRIEGAPISLEGTLGRSDGDPTVELRVEAKGLPLRDAQLYAPSTGWNALRAKLDADIHVERGATGAARIRGTASVRDVRVGVPEAADPALRADALEVEAAGIDLDARTADLSRVRVDGLRLLARPDLPPGIPLAGPLLESAGSADGAPAAPPWQIAVADARLSESALVYADSDLSWRIVEASLGDLAVRSEGHSAPGKLAFSLELREGDVARGAVDGQGRISIAPDAPLELDAELHWSDLDGPALARSLGAAAETEAVESLTSRGRIALRAADEGGGIGIEFDGEVVLSDFSLRAGREGDRCVAGFRELRVPFDKAKIAERTRLRLGAVVLREPRLRFARSAQGVSCRPSALTRATAGGEAPEGDAGAPLRLQVESLSISDGDLVLTDRTVTPFVETELTGVEGRAEALRWDPARIRRFEVSAEGLGSEPLELSGSLAGGELDVDLQAERIDMPRFNPYTTDLGGFAVDEGRLSARLDVAAEPPASLAGDARLVLHDVELTGIDPEGFRRSFGVRLPLAMAMLRNVQGDIVVDAPFSIDRDRGVDFGLGRFLAGALRRAVLNAVMSPLKLIGAVVAQGGSIDEFQPEPVRFAPGERTLSDAGRDQVRLLAELLARRPWLRVRLEPRPVAPEEDASAGGDPFALAEARAREVARALELDHGLEGRRVAVAPVPQELSRGRPRVGVAFEALGRPSDPADPDAPPGPAEQARNTSTENGG